MFIGIDLMMMGCTPLWSLYAACIGSRLIAKNDRDSVKLVSVAGRLGFDWKKYWIPGKLYALYSGF